MGQLSHMAQSVGGSLLSITSIEKRKSIKKFAKSIGSKIHLKGKKKHHDLDDGNSSIGSVNSLQKRSNSDYIGKSRQTREDADPGVVSEDDEFTVRSDHILFHFILINLLLKFDDLSHKSSGSSLNQTTSQLGTIGSSSIVSLENVTDGEVASKNSNGNLPPVKPPRAEPKLQDEWELKLYGKQSKSNKNIFTVDLLKPSSNESLNRKSWDSAKLSAQIEEEESADVLPEFIKEEDISLKSKKSPQPIKKEEKESMLSKLKKIRKGKPIR